MLSWLAQRHGQQDLKTFRAGFTNHCLVWEPGEWRPPPKSGGTVVTAPGIQSQSKAGDALAIYLEASAEPKPLVLGRDPACDVVIDDATVSSRHLAFSLRDGVWGAMSSGSTNGTQLNGAALQPELWAKLTPGDRLQVGQVRLTYYDPKGLYFRLKAGN
jgi:hypothetical protein